MLVIMVNRGEAPKTTRWFSWKATSFPETWFPMPGTGHDQRRVPKNGRGRGGGQDQLFNRVYLVDVAEFHLCWCSEWMTSRICFVVAWMCCWVFAEADGLHRRKLTWSWLVMVDVVNYPSLAMILFRRLSNSRGSKECWSCVARWTSRLSEQFRGTCWTFADNTKLHFWIHEYEPTINNH